MKKIGRALRAALPHAALILALMMLVLFVIDRFNDAMAFLNNDLTKWLLAAFCALVVCLSAAVIAEDEARRKGGADEKEPEGEENERK